MKVPMGIPFLVASRVYDLANTILIVALMLSAASTVTLVWMGNVKERYLKLELATTAARSAAADEGAAKAQLGLGEANVVIEQLKKDNLKLEVQVAPRRLKPFDAVALQNLLKLGPKTILVASYALDAESSVYGQQIYEALRLSSGRINLQNDLMTQTAGRPIVVGIAVFGSDQPLVRAVLEVLQSAGATYVTGPVPRGVRSSFGTGVHPMRPDAEIFIGVKPLPR